MLLLFSVTLLFSCGDDDDDAGGGGSSSSLTGWWAVSTNYVGGPAFHFINGNTVEKCLIQDYKDVYCPTPFTPRSGWYRGSLSTYTYVVTNGKIIITNGDILTIMNDRLVQEGMSYESGLVKLN